MEELLERSWVENVVGSRDRVVDVELVDGLGRAGFGGVGFGLHERNHERQRVIERVRASDSEYECE